MQAIPSTREAREAMEAEFGRGHRELAAVDAQREILAARGEALRVRLAEISGAIEFALQREAVEVAAAAGPAPSDGAP